MHEQLTIARCRGIKDMRSSVILITRSPVKSQKYRMPSVHRSHVIIQHNGNLEAPGGTSKSSRIDKICHTLIHCTHSNTSSTQVNWSKKQLSFDARYCGCSGFGAPGCNGAPPPSFFCRFRSSRVVPDPHFCWLITKFWAVGRMPANYRHPAK